MDRKRGSPPRGRDRFPGRDVMAPPGRDPRGGDPFKSDYGPPTSGRRRSPSPGYDRYDRRGGRGSPPPNVKRHRREDMGGYDRYMRDPSPGYRGRGHSPPPPHRGGYDERDYYDIDHRRGPPPPPPGGPPSRRSGEEDGGPGRMMSFKEFILDQPDDPSVEESQARYKQYMVEYHGGEIKAEFATKKDDEETRAMFDPRMFEKALAERNEEAKASAAQFVTDKEAGKMDASAEGFNQGMFELAQLPKPPAAAPDAPAGGATAAEDGAPANGDKAAASAAEEEDAQDGGEPSIFAPSMCWRPARVATDVRLAAKLIRKLDSEKGVEGNTLLPAVPSPSSAAAAAEEAKSPDAAAPAADMEKKNAGGEKDADASMARADADGAERAAPAPAAAAPAEGAKDPDAVEVDASNLAEVTGRLDVLLTYLWSVHGIDFYAGYELQGGEFPQRLLACRLLRGLRPEELNVGSAPADIEAAEADEKRDAELVSKTVDETWERRMAEGDPMEERCQRKRIEVAIDEWVETQIIAFQDNKWGNKLSTKLFVGKKFVLKHIRVKHEDKVTQERDRLYDEIYFENFKAFKEEEALAAEQEPPEVATEHAPAVLEDSVMGEGVYIEGYEGAGPMRGGGRMAGRMPRGRFGGRGGRFGGRGMGMPMNMMEMGGMGMAPGMGMMGMGGMGMGMGGAMFIPAPGAGPMGPFLPIMPAAASMAPMMMGGPQMGGRRGGGRMGMGGPPRGGGRMVGGRFGGRGMEGVGGGPMREYFDLDNPQNNRAVLDYGDL